MNIRQLITRSSLVLCATALAACATAPPELVEARKAYKTAEDSETQTYAPAELKSAEQMLRLAEKAFDDEGDSFKTRSLGYVAERRVQIANTEASTYQLKTKKKSLDKDYFALSEESREAAMQRAALTASELKEREQALDEKARLLEEARKAGELSEAQLRERNEALAEQAAELEAEREARIDAEKRLADAMDRLSKIAQVKEESERTVITIGGEVVFETGKSTLLPNAREKLNQVADVLLENRGKNIQVVGHTDSQGSTSSNQTLSQQRAETVRSYLVERGVASDRIIAVGKGESEPIASNDNQTGRAQNRRVEIIIENKGGKS